MTEGGDSGESAGEKGDTLPTPEDLAQQVEVTQENPQTSDKSAVDQQGMISCFSFPHIDINRFVSDLIASM